MSNINTLDNLHGDLMFKEIFGTQKNVRFTEYLLELLKGYERHSLKGKVKVLNEVFLDKTKLTDKGITSDVLAEVEDEVINLEMYTAFDHEDFEKSLAYLTRIYGTRLEIGDRYQNSLKLLNIIFVSLLMYLIFLSLKQIFFLWTEEHTILLLINWKDIFTVLTS